MKSVSIAAVSVLLFALLSWVALRSINSETESAQLAMRQLDIFAAAESSLHRDMLRARAGLLRNYDPLVRQVERLRRTIGALRSATRDDVAITIEVDRLNDMAEQQERWTEQFKSENALMQNSLAYFHVFNVRLRDSSSDIQLVLRASALATALLRLTSQSSQEALQEFDDRFADLASYPKAGRLNSADRDLTQALMAHASLLRTTLPATDRILRSVLTIPSRVQQDKLRVMVGAREAASEECASFYRNVLYGISLILVGLTVTLAMRLQSWARTLRRIARIEHVIADVSTRFIKVQPGELAGEFERALKELASCINADRGYFVRADHVEYCYTWSRGEVPWPENWARDALRFAASLDPARDGIIYRPTIHPFRSEAIPGLPADVRGWLCVPHIWRERVVGILAFDSTGEGFQARPAECRLFRTACDALANAVFRDVLMREHERLEETLQQIRRLDTVGAFASGIAHNFNNIVGAILGYTEMAQFQLEAGKVPASHLLEIRRAGERARDLVDQILKFGRQTVSTREEISLANLLSETWSLVSASLPERISLSIEEAQGDVVVRGEPEQLQQVILNVCNNAAQAIDSAGSIAVALRGRSLDGPLPLGHGTIPPGKYVVISVEDTGRGMDEATRERMFDPFFTTRPDGNGLGLATVREIVLAHGGGVGVHSAPGAGTRVEVWLPCLTCPLAAASPAAKKDRQAGVESIFLFETDRERLMRHEDIVAALGFEPVSFTDTGTAIEAIRAAPDRFDAAVICSSHDSNAALHVARALSQFALHAPVIMATSSAGDLGAWILASLGISEVVRYPLRTGELSGALERSMSNGPRAKSATADLA